jgi:hypothetical protein
MKMEGDLFSETFVTVQQNATGQNPEISTTFTAMENPNNFYSRAIIDVGN